MRPYIQTLAKDIPPYNSFFAVYRWRKGNVSKAMSMTHEAVARAVKKLGLDSAAQHSAGYGLPMVDIAIEADDQDIAMLVIFLPLL